MICGSALLLLASLGAPQPTDSAGQLSEAAVRIVLYPSYARVISLYNIDRSGTELRFDAMRAPEQLVLVDGSSGRGLDSKARQLLELRRLAAPPGPSGESEYRIVYSVSGDLTRIPLFVPNARADPERTQLRIELVGGSNGLELPDGELEFEAVGEGMLVAHPRTLPRFVTLSRAGGWDLGTRRVGWIVVFVLLALVLAVVHRARRRS